MLSRKGQGLRGSIKLFAMPVLRNIHWFVVMVLLMAVPSALTTLQDNTIHFAKVKFVVGLLQSSAIAYVLLALSQPVRIRNVIRFILTTLLAILCLAELFTFIELGSRLNSNIIGLILQTDKREAGEFVVIYIFTWKAALALCGVIIIILAGLSVKRLVGRKNLLKSPWTIIASIWILLAFVSLPITLIYKLTNGRFSDFRCTPIQMIKALQDVNDTKSELKALAFTTSHIEIDSVGRRPQRIVLIIGESYNKHHSELYGYRLNTTPCLQNISRKGNLFVFNDIVSRTVATAAVVHEIFSTDVRYLEGEWSASPLITSVFKASGYKVNLIDNHATRAHTGDWDFSSTYFLNALFIDSEFDYRNTRTYEYDGGVLQELDSLRNHGAPSLDIIHLMGQHVNAALRYPEGYDRFNPQDYPQTLSIQQREEISNYDNATYYNDYVVGAIIDYYKDDEAIIVYVPDHGEEVHDFRNQYGRTMEHLTKEIVQCTHEVPFLIWVSDKYKEANPEKVSRIRNSVSNPGVNGDVAQVLLDLGNIYGRFRNDTFNLISERYKPYKRVLREEYVYD